MEKKETKENGEDMKYYFCYIRMFKLVPNSNLLCKSSSKRSYFSIWPVALLPPIKKFNWEWEKKNALLSIWLTISKTIAIINERSS